MSGPWVLHPRCRLTYLLPFVSRLARLSQLTELLLHSSRFLGWSGPHLFFELFISSFGSDALFADLVRVNGGDVERTCLIASCGRELVSS